jgi:hypothetical protein
MLCHLLWRYGPIMSDRIVPETREERYRRQTREKFEALGRYVQAFELMVQAARQGIVLLSGGGRAADML